MKRLWMRGAALLMSAALLTGCGGKTEELSKESSSTLETLSAQSTGEGVTPGVGPSASLESSEEPKEDWSKRYDNYFSEHELNNCMMDIEYEEQGAKIRIQFSFGRTEEILYFKYAVWAGNAGKELDASEEKNSMTAYFNKDGEAYLKTIMKGKKDELYQVTGMPWETAEEMSETSNPLELGDDTFEGLSYDGEEDIDGVTYDVLYSKTLRQSQSKANRYVKTYFYINRETQELELIRVKDVTKVMDCYLTPLDPAEYSEIPAEMKSGKKVKEENFAVTFALSLVKITFNSMGIDPDQLDWSQITGQ